MVGVAGAGHWVAAAGAQARGAVSNLVIDSDGFRFVALDDAYADDFLPGAVKYGDLPGLLALAAPTKLWLAGEGNSGPLLTRDLYRVCGAESQLHVVPTRAGAPTDEAEMADWLLKIRPSK